MVTSESQLKDIITSLYYAAHYRDEIPGLQGKIDNLVSILSTLENDQIPQAANESLESNLRRLRTKLDHETREYERQELSVINSIRTILTNEEESIINKVISRSDTITEFKNYCDSLHLQVQKHGKVIKEELTAVKNSLNAVVLDKSNILEEMAADLKSQQDHLVSQFDQYSREDDLLRIQRLTRATDMLNLQELFKTTFDSGIQKIKQIYQDMEKKRKEEEEKRMADIKVSEPVIQIVQSEIKQHTSAMEAKVAEAQQKELEKEKERYTLLQKELGKIVDNMAQHRFIMDATRIWIHAEKESKLSGSSTSTENKNDCSRSDIMTFIEDIETEVADINKNLEAKVNNIDRIIQDGVKEANENAGSSFIPKKRSREDDDDDESNGEQQGIEDRLEYLDRQHQQLEDFISQFRENILDPLFPVRIETAMKKIEKVIVNHDTFIAYLFNPKPTIKDIEEEGSSKRIDPSLLHSILDIVKTEKEKSSSRLQERLKALEKELSS